MINVKTNIVAGEVAAISPKVRRLTAPNGGIMTGPGTNTYLIGWGDVAIIDPGPDIDLHIDAILEAVSAGGGRVHSIWVTHTHRDHSPAAAVLADRTGAPCYGLTLQDDGFQDTSFKADEELQDGATVATDEWCLTAVHTPGHVYNHFCFFLEGEGFMFVGDHMMQGTTVVIIPPHGVMADYIASLQKLLAYNMAAIAPGHGSIIENPVDVVQQTIRHRLARERLLLKKMSLSWQTLDDLTKAVYKGIDKRLLVVAKFSLLAHLIKLETERCVETDGAEQWRLSKKETNIV